MAGLREIPAFAGTRFFWLKNWVFEKKGENFTAENADYADFVRRLSLVARSSTDEAGEGTSEN